MNIAVIPYQESHMKDYMFQIKNRNEVGVWGIIQNELVKRGYNIHTIDCYDKFSDIDYVLIMCDNHIKYRYYSKIIAHGLGKKIIYLAEEPEFVNPKHATGKLKELLNYYPCILTWNEDAIDNKGIFKYVIPQFFAKSGEVGLPFAERKLLTGIWLDMPFEGSVPEGKNQFSVRNSLYEERRRIVDYFENREDNLFEVYGRNWPKDRFKNYKGEPNDKSEVYTKYRFAICLENQGKVRGLITEKIGDCFNNGIVPIYGGNTEIDKVIPKDCYIDYFQFETYDEMVRFLESVDEDTWQGYIDAAERFRKSEAYDYFNPVHFVEYLLNAMDKYSTSFSFSRSVHQIKYALYLWIQKKYLKIYRGIEY